MTTPPTTTRSRINGVVLVTTPPTSPVADGVPHMTNEPSPPAAPDGADPSMEEILASIRRILNDDDVPAEPAETLDAPAANDDVLVLDETMLVSEAPVDHHDPEPVAMLPEPPAPDQ